MVLRNKNYLVVIDKFQDLIAWDGIKGLFPDTEKGGILLFMTTNILDEIVGPKIDLGLYGAWHSEGMRNFHLLIFGKRSCPPELETIVLAILRCCRASRGIPTPAIHMVANYLSSINHSRDNWLNVQQSLASTLPMFNNKIIGTISALMEASKDIDSINTVSTSDENLELETNQQQIIKCHEYFLSVELEEYLKQLLLDLTESSKKLKRMEDDLWRSLKRQRYLIVVDDLWSVADWNGSRRLFSDDNVRSRILFTSRQSNVIECLKCEKIHNMNLLDEQTSWDLMQKKVFGQDISPHDLEDIGKQIGKKCQGLPLVIVVIAGVLMTITKTFECWKAVAESISSTVMSSANSCEELLALSYIAKSYLH
ncbi:hypothetical protein Leryth_024905 [Lithospermum erythrorhizon]|nr:hypothetical protein Leryth_024905 [Lithospermum erythrorhizon]